MINVKKLLLASNIATGSYALVTYNNKIEPTWFAKHNFGEGDSFLESPCTLCKVMDVDGSIHMFAREYAAKLIEEGPDVEDYANNYVKTMVVDGVLYEIENFQCDPYLPEYVDDIKLISEEECLNYMLSKAK